MNEKSKNEFRGLQEKLSGFRVDPPEEVWDHIYRNIGGGGRRRNMIILISAAASVALAVSIGFSLRFANRTITSEMAVAPGKSQALQESVVPATDAGEEPEGTKDRETGSEDIVIRRDADQQVFSGIEQTSSQDEIASLQKEPDGEQPPHPDETALPQKEPDGERLPQLYENKVQEEPGQLSETDESAGLAITQAEDLKDIQPDPLPDLMDDQGKSRVGNRWIISGVISPLYSFRDANGSQEVNSAVNNLESGTIAYAGGINVGFKPGSRLTIESGLFYNKMGINIGEVAGFAGEYMAMDFSPLPDEKFNANVITVSNTIGNIVSNSGDIFVNSYKESSVNRMEILDGAAYIDQSVTLDGVKQNLEYLEIPFNLRYAVVDRTIEIQLIGGMSTNFLVNNTVTARTGSGTEEIGYITNLNSVNYSGNAGIGMVYHFHSNFSISVEPRFRYYLNSINDNTLPATRPYTMGFYTGINYRF